MPHALHIDQPPQRATLLACFAIVAAGTLVYWNSLHAPFVFDDDRAIVQNPTIRHLWPLSRVLSPPPEATVAGRPLVNLSLAVNLALDRSLFSGRAPGHSVGVIGFHVFNLAVHLLAGLTLFGIVRRTYAAHVAGGQRAATCLALIAALLWTVHPLQTEAVTYTVQRAEAMCGLFYLLTLYCVIRGADSPSPGRSGGWYLASWAACLAGMASKEVMVSAPLIVAAYDRIFLSASWRDVGKRRGMLYLGLATTWMLLAGLVAAAGDRGESAGFWQGVSARQYAETQFGVIARYLWLCFWPGTLVFDYGDRLASEPSEIWPYAAFVAALVAATLLAIWRQPKIGFLGLVFFAVLAPTSSIVPIVTQTAAEHRMYLASAAVTVLVVALLHAAIGRLRSGQTAAEMLAVAAAAVVALALGGRTIARNGDYASNHQLWDDTVRKNPASARAHRGLCQALLAEGLPRAAIREATEALKLQEEVVSYLNRATAYLAVGEHEKAVADLDRALEIDGNDARVWYNRGLANAQAGRFEQALHDWDRAVAASPDFPAAWLNRGIVRAQTDNLAGAEEDFGRAIELEPQAADAYLYRADVRYRQKKYAPALQDLQSVETLRTSVDPSFVQEVENALKGHRMQSGVPAR